MRFQLEEIIGKPRHADTLFGRDKKLAEVFKNLGARDLTYHRWRQEFAGISTSQAKCLKELDRENGHLRKIPADLTIDQGVAKGNI